jgi:hypothetical protein
LFAALLTVASPLAPAALIAGVEPACEDEFELLELLPQAANVNDVTTAGNMNFTAERTRDSFG